MLRAISSRESDASPTIGNRNQDELFAFYRTAIDGDHVRNPGTHDELLLRSHDAMAAIRLLQRRGWKLYSTAAHSPADYAGIDFVWLAPSGAWFPLDSKPKEKVTASSLIHRATVWNYREAEECGKLDYHCKVAFLEQLVNLSRETPMLTSVCPPPAHTAMSSRQAYEELRHFKQNLEAMGGTDIRSPFRRWASTKLLKAIGHTFAQQQQNTRVDDSARQRVLSSITDAVRRFLSSANDDRGYYTNVKFHSYLEYDFKTDLLCVPAGGNTFTRIRGAAAAIRAEFARQYAELVSREGACQRLIDRKKIFDTSGIQIIISFVLDEFAVDLRPTSRRA